MIMGPDAHMMCTVFLCLSQHLHEGAEGSASFAQLQGPQLSYSQRQIPGTLVFFSSCQVLLIVVFN